MRKYVLCVPPAFVGGIWCASFSFWLGWAGCLFVCRPRPSFLPSFLPSSSTSFHFHHHQPSSSVLCATNWHWKQLWKSRETCSCFVCCCWILTTHSFDLFLFFTLFQLHWLQVTSVLFILFFQIFFTGASVSRISTQGGGPAIEWQHPKKLLKNLCSLATYNNME